METEPKQPKAKAFFNPSQDDWKHIKIYAALNNYKSAQVLLSEIVHEFVVTHPLDLTVKGDQE